MFMNLNNKKEQNKNFLLDNSKFLLIIMSMKITFFAILLVLTHSAFAKTEVRFTPSTECEDVIVSNIDKAQKSVDAAIYSIDNRRIVRALKKAHR